MAKSEIETKTHRDFMAFSFYANHCAQRGNCPCRWETLRDDLMEHWRGYADEMLAEWIADEERARKSRDEDRNPRAYFVG